MLHDYDLVVIGAGSGGVRAARMAAQAGAKVAVAESAPLGGTCVNLGCIPKKLYSYAAHYGQAFHEAKGFGWMVKQPTFNWETLKTNRATEITRLNGVYHNLLANAGVTILHGHAQIVGEHQVLVGGQIYSAKNILVATGGWPSVPDFPGNDLVITSNDMFDLPQFPQRLLVVGGGYIACEFASIFNGLGSHVVQLYRSEQILRGFDRDIRDFVAQELRKSGVDLRVNTNVTQVQQQGEDLLVTLTDGTLLAVDQVLYATGRTPRTQGLGLETVGVELGKKGQILVDEHYQTNVSSIYALGDVTDRVQLTPVALGEAMVLVDYLFGQNKRQLSYDYIPTAIFTHPNVGTVGFSEEAARQKFGQITVYKSEFKPLKHTLSGSPTRFFMKLIVDNATDRVVGLHMVGDDAGEIIQGFAVAIKMGATKADFDRTVGIHPTAAEEFVTMRTPSN